MRRGLDTTSHDQALHTRGDLGGRDACRSMAPGAVPVYGHAARLQNAAFYGCVAGDGTASQIGLGEDPIVDERPVDAQTIDRGSENLARQFFGPCVDRLPLRAVATELRMALMVRASVMVSAFSQVAIFGERPFEEWRDVVGRESARSLRRLLQDLTAQRSAMDFGWPINDCHPKAA